MLNLTLLGSTGSIGTNTLDVVRQNRDRFRIFALAAGQNVTAVLSQILEFQPKVVVTASEAGLERLSTLLAESGLARADWPETKR